MGKELTNLDIARHPERADTVEVRLHYAAAGIDAKGDFTPDGWRVIVEELRADPVDGTRLLCATLGVQTSPKIIAEIAYELSVVFALSSAAMATSRAKRPT